MQQGEIDGSRPFKRPDPPCEYSPSQAKRRRSTPFHDVCDNIIVSAENSFPKAGAKKPVVKPNRCFAEAEATIMTALHRCKLTSGLEVNLQMAMKISNNIAVKSLYYFLEERIKKTT